MIPQGTREKARRAHRDMLAAIEARQKVTRPDGTDGSGHPGIRAANLEGYLGGFTIQFLNEIERLESELQRNHRRRLRFEWSGDYDGWVVSMKTLYGNHGLYIGRLFIFWDHRATVPANRVLDHGTRVWIPRRNRKMRGR